jgi:hypothetical protein
LSAQSVRGLITRPNFDVLTKSVSRQLSETYAQYLLSQPQGIEKIRDIIVTDVRNAQHRGDRAHVLTLLHVLHHYLKSHPEAAPRVHPWSRHYRDHSTSPKGGDR